ncbi:MAG TPA: glutamyl-tRNA reductase [Tepidisphaeraceae bacterium]|jgi:glutamyl-tRNA reductase|nr:glutamyl-tRNA reductase [Tepidisphaeraceae bacterium]
MQRLMLLGLNHKTAPLELREKLNFSPPQRREALAALRDRFGQCEAVLLSTCNRVELYLVRQKHGHPRASELAEFLAAGRDVNLVELQSSLYEKSERDVVSHLFSVASSLDSMVLGETQIVGQVREAYETARVAGTAGPMLHPLFQRASAVARQVMSQTTLGEGRSSVATVAVEYARRIFDGFSDKTVLSIGAGKMAGLLLENLAALKPSKLLVCNRDAAKAESLAQNFGAAAVALDRLADHLAVADIVVSSTGSTQPIIARAVFEGVMRRRRYKPVFLIDIAVPRDVAADVGKIENVYLYNLDDLQQAVMATQDQRSAAAESAGKIVEQHVNEFVAWHRARMVGPLIDQLYQRSHALAQEELTRIVGKLSAVSDDDKRQLEDLMRRIVNKLLHDPVQAMRDGDGGHAPMSQYLHAVQKLFKLEDHALDDVDKSDGHEA